MSEIRIRLRDIVDALDVQNEAFRSYLNRQTGEVVTLALEELSAAEEDAELADFPEWQQENIRTAIAILETDDYVQLPDQFDIHEWSIMRDFCDTVSNPNHRQTLLESIHGKGAFHHFKETLYRQGMKEQWFRFREAALQQLAKGWLESEGIAYQATE